MKNLRKIRKAKEISVTELAKKVGVTRMAIYYYEKEKREPTARIAIKIANALGTTVEKLCK